MATASSATVAIKITSDAADAARGLNEASSAASKFKSGIGKAAKVMALGAAGLVAFGKSAYDAASEAEQATGAVDATFGKAAKAVHAFGETSAQTVGLATSDYENMAAVFGAQLKNMGVSGKELVPTTNELIELGADLAAQYGGTTSEAVEALSSLLRGERDPIEKYGVSIKQADIEAKKAAMGLDGLTGAADKQATTQATLALLTEQTASAQGAFARESGTAAGATQRASAEWKNASAALGTALLPYVSQAARLFSQFAKWIQKNTDVVKIVVIAFGSLTAAVWALNFAMNANPVVLITTAIIALGAALVLAYKKSKTFRHIVDSTGRVALTVFRAIRKAISVIAPILVKIGKVAWRVFYVMHIAPAKLLIKWIRKIVQWLRKLGPIFKAVGRVAATVFRAVIKAARSVIAAFRKVYQFLKRNLTAAFRAVRTVARTVGRAIVTVFRTIATVARTVARVARTVFATAFRAVATVVRTVVGAIRTVIRTIATVARAVARIYRTVFAAAFRAVATVVRTVVGAIRTVIRTIATVARSVAKVVRTVIAAAFRAVRSVVSTVVAAIKKILGGILDKARDIATFIRDNVAGAFTSFKETAVGALKAVLGPIGDVIDAIKSMIGWIGDAISGMKNLLGMEKPKGSLNVDTWPTARSARYTPAPSVSPRLLGARRTTTTSATTGTGPVVINVHGALDPDAVARQIDDLLRRRQRRTSGVTR